LLLAKAQGNPFFVGQFLQSLQRDGHRQLDAGTGRWTWQLDAIAATPLADDVVDLLTRRIGRLTPRAQYALTLAACIGSRFERATLALVSEQGDADTAAQLAEASAEGLVMAVAAESGGGATFSFVHDRVQQA